MASASLASQGRALLQWKASLQSQGLPLQSWKPSASPCNWTGVSCNVTISGGRVITEIYLSNTSLVGTLDALNFSALPSLTNLNLSFNQLNGTIPPTIATLFKLSSLDLTEELGRPRNLVFVKLARNLLTGEIPKNASMLASLYQLDLSNNKLSGEVPKDMGKLSNLEILDLSKNNLSGRVPEKLGDCFKLRLLKLGSKNLNGNIPFQIGNLVNLLDSLDMSHNSLAGDIP
ncbi:putative leucine-rich repeat receptor-like protein kinase [Cocos nucifera]|nr:putative leucine-rich repeat receptor-like protein kinase [Cocos nucifera]